MASGLPEAAAKNRSANRGIRMAEKAQSYAFSMREGRRPLGGYSNQSCVVRLDAASANYRVSRFF